MSTVIKRIYDDDDDNDDDESFRARRTVSDGLFFFLGGGQLFPCLSLLYTIRRKQPTVTTSRRHNCYSNPIY